MDAVNACRIVVAILFFLQTAHAQGEFPNAFDVALLKPIESNSECGKEGAETYCAFTADTSASIAPNCFETPCNATCPFGNSSPTLDNLLSIGQATFSGPSRPGANLSSVEFSQNTSVFIPESGFSGIVGTNGLSFACWFRQRPGNTGVLFSKASASGAERILVITVSQTSVIFQYQTTTLQTEELSITGLSLLPDTWHHIALTVYREDFALFLNGVLVQVSSLNSMVQDGEGITFLGQVAPGSDHFLGFMQDAYFASEALTERDVQGLANAPVSYVHLAPECRCPPSHPLASSLTDCGQYAGSLVSRGSVSRVNADAHPVGWMNSGGFTSSWISQLNRKDAEVVINLGALPYEMFYIFLRLSALEPRAFIIEKSTDGGLSYTPFQYYAEDCMTYFGLENNGAITEPDGVQCVTTSPLSNANIAFRPINPTERPFTYNDSPQLRDFILATNLRLSFVDIYNSSDVTLRHLYHGVLSITAVSRCACNGHAARCDITMTTYTCQCIHNTMGARCDQCRPLYNSKPWRAGITTDDFACRKCECNGHASSCHYNASLDAFPNDHLSGDGGVCDNCQDNTVGRFCEICAELFFRPPGTSLDASDVCQPCDCHLPGVTDNGDCAKSDAIPGKVAGQCNCKANVAGLKCNLCQPGFFNLTASNPNGCDLCQCSSAGTVQETQICDAASGQCICKQNVMGLECDQCRTGFTNLSSSNPEGCSPCVCDPQGSTDATCDPVMGTCSCKDGVAGPTCDRCEAGFFNFSATGCQPCMCSPAGSTSNVCNAATGQCPCRSEMTGLTCSECAVGFYNLSAGCLPCECDPAGSVNGSTACDTESGQCTCKRYVTGSRCDACISSTSELDADNPDGCTPCQCFRPNTNTSGEELCNPTSSQCVCLEGATGLSCDSCIESYYLTPEGCRPCQCTLDGAVDNVCNTSNGRCTCNHEGIAGDTCNRCALGYFLFPNCEMCNCSLAGSVNLTCDSATGRCLCKEFVEGDRCDTCIAGFNFLEVVNPSGCSAAPAEQAPPSLSLVESTTAQLTWLPPEQPNGLILYYLVYRDNTVIANVTDTTYIDRDLEAFTTYRYAIEAVNRAGSTRSVALSIRTSEAPPEGVPAPQLVAVNSTTVSASWLAPDEPNGVINQYDLLIVSASGQILDPPMFVHTGPGTQLSATVFSLQPFTGYGFVLRACTLGGCNTGPETTIITGEAPPSFQPLPNATTLSSTTIRITWSPPAVPNGVLTHFHVLLRGSPFTGSGTVVFNVTATAELSVVVEGLSPDTEYEFAVQSFTAAGGTTSEWVRVRTAEDVPSGVQPPQLTAVSSTSILINWTTPLTPNGGITSYTVYLIAPETRAVVQSTMTGTFLLDKLAPFTEYSFLLEACTQVGCTNSSSATAQTMEGVPEGQGAPRVDPLDPVGVLADWAPPTMPNGVIQDYMVQRRAAALTSSLQEYERGVSFAGRDYARFSSLSILEGSFFTTASLWFKTFDSQGTLLFGASSTSTDHLTIELRDGQPVLQYNAGSGSVRIAIESDTSFSDGQWHYLTVDRMGRDGNITVDGRLFATGSSPGEDSIIGQLSAIYVGGTPADMSTPGVNGSTFAGCVRSFTYRGMQLDFTQRDSLPEGDLSISVSGCLAEVENSIHFLGGGWLATSAVFGSPNPIDRFSLEIDFRTTDPTGVIFSAAGDMATLELTLANQMLTLTVMQSASRQQSTVSFNVCNGQWFTLSIVMQSTVLRAVIMGPNSTSGVFQPDLSVSSILLAQGTYFGGSPRVQAALGMAVRRVIFNSGVIDLRNYVDSSHLVDLAWSPVGGDLPLCNAEMTSFVTASTSYQDNTTDPFRTYLYRVGSRNSAGTAYSPWSGVRTMEGAPSGVMQATVVDSNSTSIMVTWTPPSIPNGIILRYTVTATPLRPTWGDSAQLTTSDTVSVTVEDFSAGLLALLSSLEPATVYSIALLAETSGGSGMSAGVEGNTLVDVPEDVQPPQLLSATSTSLTLTFPLPLFPNGAIIRYDVFVDGVISSSGSSTSQNISSLTPFTNYTIVLRVCTVVGCGHSGPVVFGTLPEAPQGQGNPELFVLGSQSIEARWQPPTMPNGIITEFRLILLSGPEQATETIIFTGLNLSTVVTGLQPHTTYTFVVESHNEGGSARSGPQTARTLEDVPEGILPPGLLTSNATALHLNWSTPEMPNGFIVTYRLFTLDGNLTELFSGFQFQYVVAGLQPFTAYTFLLQACTGLGCGSSELVTYTTAEALPTGVAPPNIVSITSTSITFEVLPVTEPNGVVTFTVNIEGLFLVVNDSISDEVESRVVFSGGEPGMGTAENLLPFTTYSFYLFVENSAGLVASDIVNATTLEAPPTGLSPPMVSLNNATTVTINWMAPERPNGLITQYTITLRGAGTVLTESFEGDQELVFVVNGLMPFTDYTASVTAHNGAGSITSPVTSFMTGETPPLDLDLPVVVNQSSTTVDLAWDSPGFPNGILLSYTITVNGSNITVVQPTAESTTITGLSPFTWYSITVTVCNSAGCLQSPAVVTMTTEALAVGISPPSVQVTAAGEVMISWLPPLLANGRIISFHVERRAVESMALMRIGSIDGDASFLTLLDTSALPFTVYLYRVVVENGAGESVGPYANFTTPQAPPEFVMAPTVTSLSSTSLNISWQPPAQPNGILTGYILKRQQGTDQMLIVGELGPDVLQYADNNLSPFTNYSYTITACTAGGCTESLPAFGVTEEALPSGLVTPSGIASGSTSIVVAWDTPGFPNGVILRYLLYRDELDGGNMTVTANLSSFALVYEGLDTSFEDAGLEPFSSYIYVYEAENGAGTAVSPATEPVMTQAAPPVSGPSLFAEAINSSSVWAEWSPPPLEEVMGPILSYELSLTPQGMPGETLVVFRGLATSFLATGLQPSTVYVVVVALNNGAGLGFSNNVTVTTAEGIPAGVQLPSVTALSAVALQFDWTEPLFPNGQIILYTLYLNSIAVHNSSMVGSVVIEGLTPFTNYTYQLEACTQFGCSRSSRLGFVQTPEGLPQGLAAPVVLITGSTSATVSWMEPSEPNGIIVEYQVYKRVQVPCVGDDMCVYVECPVSHSQCGDKCYTVTEQVCCAGVLYDIQPNSVCCGTNYLASNSSLTQVCCGGQLHLAQSGSQCCAGRYVTVPSGSVCCETPDLMPRIGPGTACCGDTPFTQSDDVTCCGGVVTTSTANSMCCGGQVVSLQSTECCSGVAHTRFDSRVCCGEEYVEPELSLCCPLDNGDARVFTYDSAAAKMAANEKCCNGFLIPEEDSCCHGNSYNASVSICADRPTTNSTTMCGTGVSCPVSQASSAFCNRCDFNAETSMCGIHTTSPNTVSMDGTMCYEVTLVLSGLAFEYRAMNLTPFTEYGYSVVALNSAGNVSTGFVTAVTDEAPPSAVEQPAVSVLSATSISITWVHPSTPNGIIASVNLLRNDTAIFSSLTAFSYIDGNLTAFTAYSYSLEVCTGGGCRQSPDTVAVTSADLPAGLADPIVANRTAATITLTWSLPDALNGLLQEFILNETTTFGQVFRGIGLSTQLTGLMPFMNYSFVLSVCNQVGCISSNEITVRTFASPPVGVDPPVVQILTARSLDISWTQPNLPNGVILGFILRRNDEVIYNATNLTYLDTGLTPDMQYSYTVEAYNSAGGTESGPSIVRTPQDSPDGLLPPSLEVLNSTAIAVTWTAPSEPNGVITRYELLVNGIQQEVAGLVLEFLLSGLTPDTVYAIRVEACTISGCATSTETVARTLQALPSGFSAPTLRVLGPTAIEVTWQPPTTPNGDIEVYEVRRMTEDSPIPTLVHVGGPNVLAFNNTGLQPFTLYQYQVRVRNGAGGTLSPLAEARTPEDVPSGVSNPFVSEIAATSVLVSWQQPLAPNGLLLRFDIYLRLTLEPATLGPGVPQLVFSGPANITTALVSPLMPATSYEVMLVAVNSAGQGESDWIPFETAEAPPQNLQPIRLVDVPDTGMALVLAWDPPLLPNGAITAYALLVNGTEVVRGLVTMHTVMQLQPFRTYSLQLEVCTSAGCSRGDVLFATTAEVPPSGQQPPSLSVLTATTILVSWQPPLASNGDLLRYQVLRRRPAPIGSQTINEPMVVYNASDLDILAYNDSSLQPFTVYEYAVQSINSAGFAESVFVQARTSQAAPEGIAAPILTVLGPTSISVQWSAPNQLNGILSGYEVIRNGSTIAPTFALSHTDTLLTAFTVYDYAISACTTAGCTTSATSTARTAEALPTGLFDPLAAPQSSQSVLIAWSAPIFPNGVITSYMITLQPDSIQVVHTDLANLQVEISGLSPFTNYTVMLTACNTAGCSEERTTMVTTLEDVPQIILPPTLQVLGPSSVEVTWREPAVPNGQIIRYELRRNGTLIFSGAALMYIDSSLTPNTMYGYDIQAYTVAGGGTRSAVSTVLTRSDTPAGIVPPVLIPLSSTSIEARWVEPQMPNGDVTEYRLFLNGTEVFRGTAFQHTVTGLLPYMVYEFILSVCTTTCGFSTRVYNRTLEAAPLNIAPPNLQALSNVTVFVTWNPPTSPNGEIVSYVLERRMAGGSQVTMVFRGLAVSHLDDSSELLPAMEYQYRVTAANSVAGATSDFASVTTSEAPPQGVQAPEIVSVTSTSIALLIRPPLSPNGVITVYNIYSGNGVLAGEVVPTDTDTQAAVFTALNLRPFTAYTFFVEACTASGCTSGPEAQFRTAEFQPLSLAPPTAFATDGRTIFVNWTAPAEPNGNITRYTLWFRTSCPQPQQFQAAECIVGQPTSVFSGLPVGGSLSFSFSSSPGSSAHPLPYTSYEFLLQAENSVGAVNSTMLSSVVTTPADAPEVVGGVLARVFENNDSILVEWSGTFRLNGLLQFYRLRRNSTAIFDGLDTSTVLLSEPKGRALIYTVTVMTSDGVTILDATSPPVTVIIPDLPNPTAMPTSPTTQPSFNTTTTPGTTPVLSPGVIVAIVLVCIILCTCITCGVAIVITSCILPQKEGGVRKKKKKRFNRRSTEQADSFTHQRFYDHELTDFEPRPYRAKWSPGDPSEPGIWADQEPPLELPPSVANGTSRTSSKRYSYSLLDAQQQYPQQYGIAVRQSYISTAPSSSYADPKTYFYGTYEGDDDFYEDDEPVACTFTDTHI